MIIEKKCKICGEWVARNKIAMHYWNIHKKKYAEYRDGEEIREVEDEKKASEEVNEGRAEVLREERREVKIEKPVMVDVPKRYIDECEGDVINEWC